MRQVRKALSAFLSVVMIAVPALATSQGLLHDHSDWVDDLDRRIVQSLLADLKASADREAENFLLRHFVVEEEVDAAPQPAGEDFCCVGIGAACGVALICDFTLGLLYGVAGFGRNLFSRAESVHLSAMTPPPRAL